MSKIGSKMNFEVSAIPFQLYELRMKKKFVSLNITAACVKLYEIVRISELQ